MHGEGELCGKGELYEEGEMLGERGSAMNEFGVVSSQASTTIREAKKDVEAVAHKSRGRETQR